MSALRLLAHPLCFVAVVAVVLTLLLSIALSYDGYWPVFRPYRIRLLLILGLWIWALTLLCLHGI